MLHPCFSRAIPSSSGTNRLVMARQDLKDDRSFRKAAPACRLQMAAGQIETHVKFRDEPCSHLFMLTSTSLVPKLVSKCYYFLHLMTV